MTRIAFLIEALTVIIGLPWCVSCGLMWMGCVEPELSARERLLYEAMQTRLQKREQLHREDAATSETEQELNPQI
jgi:hypothetical protein